MNALREVELHDTSRASIGDTIITRRNDRRLNSGRGWVRNGDRWVVTGVRDDGSLTGRRAGTRPGGAVVLPTGYVAEHVDLGYAVTAHRAQGSTFDTAHAVVRSPEMTRESLYVSMTRGRESNTVYVATDQAHLEEHQHRHDLEMSARSILYGILHHGGVEKSAHEIITTEQDMWGSVRQLAAEYETIAVEAQQQRWISLLETGGLTRGQIDDLVDADAFGVLAAELRRMEADGHNIDELLPRVIRAGNLTDVDDLGSLLRYRMQRLTAQFSPTTSRKRRPLIVGLIPAAAGLMAADMREALDQRERLIQERVTALAQTALTKQLPWAESLGTSRADQAENDAWLTHLEVIAAYRDRWGITSTAVLGNLPDNDAQRIDYERARTHVAEMHNAGEADHEPHMRVQSISAPRGACSRNSDVVVAGCCVRGKRNANP